jgi:glycerate dehydrogenase
MYNVIIGVDFMKIVLTDAQTVLDEIVDASKLRELGEVCEYGLLKYDEVAEKIANADIVVCNKTMLNAHTLRLAKNLKYIGLFATGYNNIDIDYCAQNNIAVCNAGSYSTNAVAQHTFALILEHYNSTSKYNQFVQDGKWKRSKTFSPFVYPLSELAGKTIGIVGLGSIGKAVAKIANAFEMNVIACNRSPREVEGVKMVSFDELLKQSDIVTVHCPLNRESENMFDKTAFAKMKQGSLFVNTARGAVMSEQALFEALQSGHLGGAAIDTLAVEPMEEDCILMGAKNCIMTPHIAWAPVETRVRLMNIVVDNIKNFLDGHPTNKVN